MIGIPPDVKIHPAFRLFTWRPKGVLTPDTLSKIIAFIEYEEQETKEPFNRFTDLSALSVMDLDFEYFVRVSMHRRKACAGRELVKSAFFSTDADSTHLAKVHAILTEYTPLEVAVFSKLDEASEWLGVPQEIILP